MIEYQGLYKRWQISPLADYVDHIQSAVTAALEKGHGDMERWNTVLEALPLVAPSLTRYDTPIIEIGLANELSLSDRDQLERHLMALHPWRKGPFSLFGIHIDSEWRSDIKWARLENHISPLAGRRVLDVGSGNGYYALRMFGAGAAEVIGIDPTWLFVFQFYCVKHFLAPVPVDILPLSLEQMPASMPVFDTAFSMGVIYHRRSPIEHLQHLKRCLRPGGELVLETLVIDGAAGDVLIPGERYAKMRNVWSVPSAATVLTWLEDAGFTDGRLLDVSRTTPAEQRSTPWMCFESLSDFLDSADTSRTIEGFPAPQRGLFTACAP